LIIKVSKLFCDGMIFVDRLWDLDDGCAAYQQVHEKLVAHPARGSDSSLRRPFQIDGSTVDQNGVPQFCLRDISFSLQKVLLKRKPQALASDNRSDGTKGFTARTAGA
jgi:hypothetical protein